MISVARSSSLWQHDNNHNLETQLSAITTTTTSYVYSDTSSIARFPDFQFSLGTLSELASAQGKTCLLLAVLEVEGPDEVTVRRGPDAGHVVSVLRLIVGDEASTIRKLTAWREVAEAWGGATQDAVGIRNGDVVYFESTSLGWPYHFIITCSAYHIIADSDPYDTRRTSDAYGRQRQRRRQRQSTNIGDECTRHHSVAESPLTRKNMLSDDASDVRANRYATTTRPAPWRE